MKVRSFSDFASTEDLVKAWNTPDEEWTLIDTYAVAGKVIELYKSSWGRWQVLRLWLNVNRAITFQREAQALEVYDANCRLMDRKWFEPAPPPNGWGRFA